jgi:isoprenylcysteine carboxyl methyltransferase (ICMT) family protein YpbQ
MKSRKLRFVLMFLATILSLGLSYAAAQAQCAKIDAGGTVYGDYDCRLITTCHGWCYYSCTCTNLRFGASCDTVLLEAGFVLTESEPLC